MKDNNVFNLSSFKLENHHITLLNRGLGFIPTPTFTNQTKLVKELDRFHRRLLLHYYFTKKNLDNNITDDHQDVYTFLKSLGRNPDWKPNITNPYINNLIHKLSGKISSINNKNIKRNLSKKEKSALHDLKNNKNIIIKKCDKGGGIAILDRTVYIHKIETMLTDKDTYIEINDANSKQQKSKSDDLIKYALAMKGGITEKQLRNIHKRKVTTPHFYGIVKIHKQNYPLRPIISQIDSPTAEINDIVDHYLETAMKYIPEILNDTTHFLNKLTTINNITDSTILITADITSLYTNIPQKEGTKWVAEFYQDTLKYWTVEDKNQYTFLPTIKLREMITHILKSSTFEFDNNTYRQLHGTTMGAQFSVKYAQIYMHVWMKKFKEQNPEEVFDIYLRFIDDIFATTNHRREDLNTYIDKLNKFHPKIKFEFANSLTEVNFLDVKIYKHNNKLETTLYTKPTDRKKYLHYTSAHTKPNKTGIPKSQFIRLRRIISNEQEFDKQIQILENKFVERGYPKKLINNAKEYIKQTPRSLTLTKHSADQKQQKFQTFLKGKPFLPLITTFYPWYEYHNTSLRKNLENIFTEFLSKLNPQSEELVEQTTYNIFKNCMPQLVYSRAKSLGDILTRSRLPKLEELNGDEELINTLAYLLQTAND